MIRFFWFLLTVGFGIIVFYTGSEYRILSDPRRAAKLAKEVGFPNGVTAFQDRSLDLVRRLFAKLLKIETIGFLLALAGAIIELL